MINFTKDFIDQLIIQEQYNDCQVLDMSYDQNSKTVIFADIILEKQFKFQENDDCCTIIELQKNQEIGIEQYIFSVN